MESHPASGYGVTFLSGNGGWQRAGIFKGNDRCVGVSSGLPVLRRWAGEGRLGA